MPDQTYLQQAQPSTFGHYLLSFAYPVLRDAERLLDELVEVNASPGGAGCVNGSRSSTTGRALADAARLRLRSSSTPVTRCGRPTGFVHVLATAPRAWCPHRQQAGRGPGDLVVQREFDFVDLADGFSRSERPDAAEAQPLLRCLSFAAPRGVLIGRLSGFLGGDQEPVRAQRQPDLRLRRGAPRLRPGASG